MAKVADLDNEFEFERSRAKQQVGAQVQGQKDALKRRFAAIGSVNSGAAIKQDQLAEQAGAERLQQANEGINAAQRSEARRMNEVQQARDFARTEREAGQTFQGGMFDKQGALQRELQNAGFSFQDRQGGLSREFQERLTGRAEAFQDRQGGLAREEAARNRAEADRQGGINRDFQAKMAGDAQRIQQGQFDQSIGFSRDQLAEEKRINDENLKIARQMLGERDFFDKMLFPQGLEDIPGIGGLVKAGNFTGNRGGYSGGSPGFGSVFTNPFY
jgi:hypothetical protein